MAEVDPVFSKPLPLSPVWNLGRFRGDWHVRRSQAVKRRGLHQSFGNLKGLGDIRTGFQNQVSWNLRGKIPERRQAERSLKVSAFTTFLSQTRDLCRATGYEANVEHEKNKSVTGSLTALRGK